MSVEFRDEARAAMFERYWKSGSGRAFARRHFYAAGPVTAAPMICRCLGDQVGNSGTASSVSFCLSAFDMLASMAKHSSHILELAKRGAQARFQDLVQEAKLLLQLFPHIRDSFDKDELPISFIMAKGSGRLTKRNVVRRPRRLSAVQRKAVSQRMKKYWAAKRQAKKA